MCRIWRPPRNSIFVRSKLLLQVISLWLIFTLRIDVYALRDLMGHCYVHFAFLFTLSKESALVYITLILFVRRRLFWSFFLDVGLLSLIVISVASVIWMVCSLAVIFFFVSTILKCPGGPLTLNIFPSEFLLFSFASSTIFLLFLTRGALDLGHPTSQEYETT